MGKAWPKVVIIKTPICVGDIVTWDPGDGSTPCPDLMVRSIHDNGNLSLSGTFIKDSKEVGECRHIPSIECIFDRKNSYHNKTYL